MENITISIAKDFSLTPGPRVISEGPFSGQLFRQTILEPKYIEARKADKKITVDLDGTLGYGPSFLEEIFGGLARIYPENEVAETLKIISHEEEYLVEEIKEYIRDARNKPPK